jgi:hypothetical protein
VGGAPAHPASSTRAPHGDQVQVRRIGSLGAGMGAATLAIGSARIRRKPAPGLQSVASRPRPVAAHTLQSAAAQGFPDVTRAVQEEGMSTLVGFTLVAGGSTIWPSNQSMSRQAHPIRGKTK